MKTHDAGVLTGPEIIASVKRGTINIVPFDENNIDDDRVNPASYDLTLGDKVAVYTNVVVPDFDSWNLLPSGWNVRTRPYRTSGSMEIAVLDSAKPNPIAIHKMESDKPFQLNPGIGYLMHTVERIHTDRYVPIIDGKSSIGRLFATAHITAGFGDAGFDGQYTLEVVVTHPLLVYPGMRFCQMRFHTMVGEIHSYKKKGNYQGKLAEGPVPSQSWKMFSKK